MADDQYKEARERALDALAALAAGVNENGYVPKEGEPGYEAPQTGITGQPLTHEGGAEFDDQPHPADAGMTGTLGQKLDGHEPHPADAGPAEFGTHETGIAGQPLTHEGGAEFDDQPHPADVFPEDTLETHEAHPGDAAPTSMLETHETPTLPTRKSFPNAEETHESPHPADAGPAEFGTHETHETLGHISAEEREARIDAALEADNMALAEHYAKAENPSLVDGCDPAIDRQDMTPEQIATLNKQVLIELKASGFMDGAESSVCGDHDYAASFAQETGIVEPSIVGGMTHEADAPVIEAPKVDSGLSL